MVYISSSNHSQKLYKPTNDETDPTVMVFPCTRHKGARGVVQDSAHLDFYVLQERKFVLTCNNQAYNVPAFLVKIYPSRLTLDFMITNTIVHFI